MKMYLAEYRSRPGQRERQQAAMTNWVRQNADQMRTYREVNRDRRAEQVRVWKQRHLQAVAEYEARRRARKRGSGSGAKYTRVEIADRDHWICGLCHQPIPQETDELRLSLTVDHTVPLSLGGPDHPDNLQAAHYGCNSAKGARI